MMLRLEELGQTIQKALLDKAPRSFGGEAAVTGAAEGYESRFYAILPEVLDKPVNRRKDVLLRYCFLMTVKNVGPGGEPDVEAPVALFQNMTVVE
jgi:hypothetical protein